MSFESLLNRTVDLKRKTDKVLDATTITASIAPDRNPNEAAWLVATVASCSDGTGEITVTGTDSDDAAQTERIIFTGNASKQSTSQFKTVTGITSSGFVGETTVGTLEVKAVTQMGQQIYFEATIQASVKARINEQRGRLAYLPQGQAVSCSHKAFCSFSDDYTPTEDDILVEGLSKYKVIFANRVYGQLSAHHWELLMDQL